MIQKFIEIVLFKQQNVANKQSCSNSLVRNTKVGSITVPLTSCLTCLDWPFLQIKTKIVSSHTADSKPVKQEVNSTMILPPLVFPAQFSAIFGYGQIARYTILAKQGQGKSSKGTLTEWEGSVQLNPSLTLLVLLKKRLILTGEYKEVISTESSPSIRIPWSS